MSNLPIRIEIPNFIRVVRMSEKQQPKYFEWNGVFIKGKNKNLPVKFYRDKKNIIDKPQIEDLKDGFMMGHLIKGVIGTTYMNTTLIPKEISTGKIVLCTIEEKKIIPIIRNPKTVGKPRDYLIRGQDIYNNFLDPFSRGKIMEAIKNCYYKYVKGIPVITDYPIKIEVELYESIKNPYDNGNINGIGQHWDIDNYVFPYMKAFPDLLVKLGKIKDDDRLHLTQTPGVKFIPVEHHNQRKFVFIISKDDRPEIAENNIYKSYHKNKNTYETEDHDLIDDGPFPSLEVPIPNIDILGNIMCWGTGGRINKKLIDFEKQFKNPKNE